MRALASRTRLHEESCSKPVRTCLLAFAAITLPLAFASAQPAAYSFTTLDGPEIHQTSALAINDGGQVLGVYRIGTGPQERGFVWQNGVFTTIDLPGAVRTDPAAINAAGQVVGRFFDAANAQHGFLWQPGRFTPIEGPDHETTTPRDINDAGQIVGSYYGSDGLSHGFLWEAGESTRFDVDFVEDPWGVDTYATGINSAGQVIGHYLLRAAERTGGYRSSGGQFSSIDGPDAWDTFPRDINGAGEVIGVYFVGLDHSFIWDDGTMTNIDNPDVVSQTEATAISATGQIVGWYGYGPEHTFLLDHGTFTSVDPPGATASGANGINGAGQIVGTYWDASGSHGFVATPKPVVNGLVKMTGLTQSFDPSPAQNAPAGKFTINATFMNTSTSPIEGPAFRVLELTGGNLLLNAEGGAAGIGGVLSASAAGDGIASPAESFTTTFVVGLQSRRPFTFLVDVLGMPEN